MALCSDDIPVQYVDAFRLALLHLAREVEGINGQNRVLGVTKFKSYLLNVVK